MDQKWKEMALKVVIIINGNSNNNIKPRDVITAESDDSVHNADDKM